MLRRVLRRMGAMHCDHQAAWKAVLVVALEVHLLRFSTDFANWLLMVGVVQSLQAVIGHNSRKRDKIQWVGKPCTSASWLARRVVQLCAQWSWLSIALSQQVQSHHRYSRIICHQRDQCSWWMIFRTIQHKVIIIPFAGQSWSWTAVKSLPVRLIL